jgi:ABC-2 type transport system ATP-binding protein
MISVKNLSKKFGATIAVDAVSFDIPQGQLVGFLGPNGAGKTTTMRLLTGYLTPDDGEALLMGHSLSEESVEIRRHLGYLPENNPLPDDIEVTDYLHFVGSLRAMHDAHAREKRIRQLLDICSLGEVVGKKLGELSKGYRQRVGFAQAIIHDPQILILDEPTSGLDPNQVQDVRRLIQELKKEKTLLLSTHILSEVQHACDRVLIINRGRVVADGTPGALSGEMQPGSRVQVALKGPEAQVREMLANLPGVTGLTDKIFDGGEKGFVLESASGDDLREEIFRTAVAKNWPLLTLKLERMSLEEVFRTLTTTTHE